MVSGTPAISTMVTSASLSCTCLGLRWFIQTEACQLRVPLEASSALVTCAPSGVCDLVLLAPGEVQTQGVHRTGIGGMVSTNTSSIYTRVAPLSRRAGPESPRWDTETIGLDIKAGSGRKLSWMFPREALWISSPATIAGGSWTDQCYLTLA